MEPDILSPKDLKTKLLARNQGTDSLASHVQSQSLFQDLGEMPIGKAWENQRSQMEGYFPGLRPKGGMMKNETINKYVRNL